MQIKRIVYLLFFTAFLIASCEKDTEASHEVEQKTETIEGTEHAELNGLNPISGKKSISLSSKAACGGSYGGTYNVVNRYYPYPYKTIDVSCAAMGSTITISVVAHGIPNRFVLKDTSGNIVKQKNSTRNVDSGWIGTADYYGRWGSSLSTNNTYTYSFVKTKQTYRLYVETQTAPRSSRYYGVGDRWNTTVSCACGGSDPDPDPDPTCNTPNDCGKFFNGSFNTINRYHPYPAKNLRVSCVKTGATIQLKVSALGVPNKFVVKDSRGKTVASSSTSSNPGGWMGYANYPGQWGSSLSQTNTRTLYWRKDASISTYKLYVYTQTPPSLNYNPTYDSWRASLGCSPKNN